MKSIPKALLIQKDTTTFRCQPCQYSFEALVSRVEDRPGDVHPFEYFASCPECGEEVTEAPHIKNLYKAWLNITGTGSPEKSAANLPPPSDPRRHFGALKHGMFAKKAKYFPAKVGRYAECEGCIYSSDCEAGGVCLEITKLRMMVTRAFDAKDPQALQPLFQDIQSDTFVLLRRMINQVLADGVVLKSPVFCGGKDGYQLVKDEDEKQVIQTDIHPAMKAISDLIQKNGLSLSDLQMTPKTQIDQSIALGNMERTQTERKTLQEMHEERKLLMKGFFKELSTAPGARENDPVFQDQQEESV